MFDHNNSTARVAAYTMGYLIAARILAASAGQTSSDDV
jgi:hypothetical protein